jgi:uracil-xanthine permease
LFVTRQLLNLFLAQVLASGYDFGNPPSACTAGQTSLPYGSAEYIGLGFSVIAFLVVIELFGSVFMKNCNVVLALLFGYFVAGISRYDNDGESLKYVLPDNINNADPITFLWTETFPLGFYAPAVIPLLIAYLVTTVETVGDISAVYEVSELDTESTDYDESIQGGLTADAISSILSTLFTSMPNTTFSQNNGVIALTKCASRRAGIACGIWLILMGVFGKIAGILTSIPDCVLGGMTIFLFSNVLVSGITLANQCDLHSRRTKFIFALSLAIGVGVTVWPYAFLDMRASGYTAAFWTCADCSNAMKGLRNGVSIFLSTGYVEELLYIYSDQ